MGQNVRMPNYAYIGSSPSGYSAGPVNPPVKDLSDQNEFDKWKRYLIANPSDSTGCFQGYLREIDRFGNIRMFSRLLGDREIGLEDRLTGEVLETIHSYVGSHQLGSGWNCLISSDLRSYVENHLTDLAGRRAYDLSLKQWFLSAGDVAQKQNILELIDWNYNDPLNESRKKFFQSVAWHFSSVEMIVKNYVERLGKYLLSTDKYSPEDKRNIKEYVDGLALLDVKSSAEVLSRYFNFGMTRYEDSQFVTQLLKGALRCMGWHGEIVHERFKSDDLKDEFEQPVSEDTPTKEWSFGKDVMIRVFLKKLNEVNFSLGQDENNLCKVLLNSNSTELLEADQLLLVNIFKIVFESVSNDLGDLKDRAEELLRRAHMLSGYQVVRDQALKILFPKNSKGVYEAGEKDPRIQKTIDEGKFEIKGWIGKFPFVGKWVAKHLSFSLSIAGVFGGAATLLVQQGAKVYEEVQKEDSFDISLKHLFAGEYDDALVQVNKGLKSAENNNNRKKILKGLIIRAAVKLQMRDLKGTEADFKRALKRLSGKNELILKQFLHEKKGAVRWDAFQKILLIVNAPITKFEEDVKTSLRSSVVAMRTRKISFKGHAFFPRLSQPQPKAKQHRLRKYRRGK